MARWQSKVCLLVALTGVACGADVTAPADDINGFSFSSDTILLAQGDTIAMSMAVTTVGTTGGATVFETSNADVATIDSRGVIVARAPGTVTITTRSASDSSVSLSRSIIVRSGVIFIGDSITEQLGALATWFGTAAKHWINAGVGGEDAAQVAARVHSAIDPARARVVVVLVGINDIQAGAGNGDEQRDLVPPGSPRNSYTSIGGHVRAIVDSARSRGVQPILATLMPVTSGRPDAATLNPKITTLNEWIRAYAHAQGLRIIDYNTAFRAPDGSGRAGLYQADGLHPNDSGRAVIAATARPVLSSIGAL